MLSKAALAMVMFAALASFPSENSGGKTSEREACAVIPEALRKVDELKPGSSRKLVEQSFVLDGGMQFSATSRYIFKKCRFIKVDVEFSSEKGERALEAAPTDRVLKVSQLYLAYPSFD